MEKKITNKSELQERRQLIFKYIRLVIINARENLGKIRPSPQMKDIQKKLGLSHKKIILEAANNVTK
jgi:hypothetical protein